MIRFDSWDLTAIFQMSCVLAVQWDGHVGRSWLHCKTGLTESYIPPSHWSLAVLAVGIKRCLFLIQMAAYINTLSTYKEVPSPVALNVPLESKGFYVLILKRSQGRCAFFARTRVPVSHWVLSVRPKPPPAFPTVIDTQLLRSSPWSCAGALHVGQALGFTKHTHQQQAWPWSPPPPPGTFLIETTSSHWARTPSYSLSTHTDSWLTE